MLSGFLIDYYTWHIPLIIVSISGFLCVILLFTIQEPKRGEKDGHSHEMKEDVVDMSYKIKLEDLKQIWKIKTTISTLCLNFVMFIGIGAVSSFFISMLKNDFFLSSTVATSFLVIAFGTQIPSGLIFGKLGDKKYQSDKKGRIKVVSICLLGAQFHI